MEDLNNDIDNLIGKYLAGEASSDEQKLIETWLSISKSNQKYFDDLREIFTRSSSIAAVQPFDADAAWEKMRGRLEGKTVRLNPERSDFSFLKIAAAILALVVASFMIYRYFETPAIQTLEIASTQATRSDTLPDGTGVFLNKSSQIAYEYNPKKRERKVKLKGEAYFEIHHSEQESFVIDVEQVFIRDIGTEFNVKAYPDSAFIEVVVEEGEVNFYTSSDNGIDIKAGEKGRYDKLSKSFTLLKPEANETSYRTKVFTFNDRRLDEIVESLNEVYDTRIEINEAIAACRVSVNFDNENINEIAEILAETLNLKITQTGLTLKLEGAGCIQ